MNVLSLFDGIGCGRLALRRAGIHVDNYFASEIDAKAMSVALNNFPDIKHIGNVKGVSAEYLPKIDLLMGGSPCFVAGTLVFTDKGYVPIEDIQAGDSVLTHKGRFRQVLRVGSNLNQPIFAIKGMGNLGVYGTADHPIYTRTRSRKWRTHPTRGYTRIFSEPKWTLLKDVSINDFMAIPPLNQETAEIIAPELSKMFWYMIGRYTGDGWYRKTKRKHRKNSFVYQFIICCGHHEFDVVKSKFDAFGYPYNFSKERTGYKFKICSQALVEFVEPIGKGAANKVVHPLVFSASNTDQKAFLQGLFDSDGSQKLRGKRTIQRYATTSYRLALGVQLLVSSVLHRPSSLYVSKTKTGKCVIEGREVTCRDGYEVCFCPVASKQDCAFNEDGYSWLPVKSVTDTGAVATVYNLEVDEDNSYTVNNFIVHNCQGLSVAGKRLRFDDPRSALFWEFVRLLKELKPKYFLLENVKMRKEDRDVIEEALGVEGILINSALVSCQNRERWYWTNIPHVSLPVDRCIYVKDILEPEVDESFWCSQAFLEAKDLKWVNQPKDTPINGLNQVTAVAKNNAQAGRVYDIMGKGPTMMAEAGGLGGKTGLFLVPKIFQSTNRGTNKQGMKEYNGKLPCITASKWQDNFFCVLEGYGVRRFTPIEAERAQTLPDDYTAGHSKTARYKMIGNAWTVDVIAYILNHIPS